MPYRLAPIPDLHNRPHPSTSPDPVRTMQEANVIPKEAIDAAAEALEKRAENDDWEWCLGDAKAALEAAAPYLRAQALEEAADALDRLHRIGATRSDQCTPEEKADYRAYAEFNGGHSGWLRDRAEST